MVNELQTRAAGPRPRRPKHPKRPVSAEQPQDVLRCLCRAGEWCRHCQPGRGCGIHPTRPYVCRGFYCEWMISKGLGPEWKPERSKFALFRTNDGRRLTAPVDPGFPSAWRRSPYYEHFKRWAREAANKTPDMHAVDVMIGEHSTMILPDREVEVGIVAPDELVRLNKRMTPMGEVIEVEKIKRAPGS